MLSVLAGIMGIGAIIIVIALITGVEKKKHDSVLLHASIAAFCMVLCLGFTFTGRVIENEMLWRAEKEKERFECRIISMDAEKVVYFDETQKGLTKVETLNIAADADNVEVIETDLEAAKVVVFKIDEEYSFIEWILTFKKSRGQYETYQVIVPNGTVTGES